MKVIVNEDYEGEEHVVFNVHRLPPAFEAIISRIECVGHSLSVLSTTGVAMHVRVEDIYYIETVDDSVYVYLREDMPYSITDRRLSELEDKLSSYGFVRVSKTTLVNINRIRRFAAAGNGKQRALLENGEEVLVSRQYTAAVLKRLSWGDAQ